MDCTNYERLLNSCSNTIPIANAQDAFTNSHTEPYFIAQHMFYYVFLVQVLLDTWQKVFFQNTL